MDIRKITATFSVTGQIAPADLPAIAQAGFRAIICNRPDGEAADQAGFREIEQAEGRPPTPIVAVTAGILRDERTACLASGMNDFLPKPFRRADLAEALLRWRPRRAPAAGRQSRP